MALQEDVFYENSVAATIINVGQLGNMSSTVFSSGLCIGKRVLAQLERDDLMPSDRNLFQFAADQIAADNLGVFASELLQEAIEKRKTQKKQIETSVLRDVLSQITED